MKFKMIKMLDDNGKEFVLERTNKVKVFSDGSDCIVVTVNNGSVLNTFHADNVNSRFIAIQIYNSLHNRDGNEYEIANLVSALNLLIEFTNIE